MGTRDSLEAAARLSPAAATAVAAAAASAAASCGAFVLWSAGEGAAPSLALVVLPLILSPALVAAAAWLAARRAIRTRLEAAAESLDRIAALDLSAPDPLAPGDGAERLEEALERCRAALAGRQGTAKVHAAVARLMAAAVRRLAEGDFSARVTVELPVPYRPFRDDFNAAMETLERAYGALDASGARLRESAREIGEAADLLARRAGKLADRIGIDLSAIEAGGARHPEEALRLARHTMGGAGVAAQRNAEAAGRFADLGLKVAREAEHLAALARGLRPEEGEAGTPDEPAVLPAATAFPMTVGATALKLDDRP